MKILAILFLSILVLGFLFVQWANKPENVEALQKKRAMEAAQKIKDEKKQVAIQKEQVVVQKEIETKKASMKLAIDENFANSRFEQLDFRYSNISYFDVKKNELNFSGMVYKGQNPQAYFMISNDDFGDFTAEMQTGIWGGDSYAGIFWGAQPNGDKNPNQYQAAYASPNTLYVEAGDDEHFGLGGLISSENNQLLRVERFGKHVQISVNGRVLFNENVASAERGKVGIIIGHRGGIRPNIESISIGIKQFKVWQ
ncbi:hypothetical protein GO755_25845 [Spirosoma sp. HMF4905]|uniref:DUF1080 domain-containing protein n=1 Tax=Spirosoma arboris TaxID=2682092 RepID=A0A7K1SIU3_9BACT|nr:hypothetical protein [Spirosoma arboris]MVM33486.1 hypothetical protein [Spirosoma arboris]